jgi:hypothetical protein
VLLQAKEGAALIVFQSRLDGLHIATTLQFEILDRDTAGHFFLKKEFSACYSNFAGRVRAISTVVIASGLVLAKNSGNFFCHVQTGSSFGEG